MTRLSAEPRNPATTKPSAASRVSLWRAASLAILLIIPNLYFATERGTSWAAPPGTLSLFYNVIVTLLGLALLNAPIKRFAPRHAMTQAEMLLIYVMLSIATAVAGHDELEIVASIARHAYLHATPGNDWQNLIFPHLPNWLVVTDVRTLTAQERGDSSVFVGGNWRGWVAPVISWSSFFAVVVFMGFCLSVIVRKQWIEHERLSYPVIQLPYEMTTGGGSSTFFANRLLWLGFVLAALGDTINGLHHFFPVVPELPLRTINLGNYFTEKPMNAIGWTPLCFFPFVIGLAYFIPANLSLSLWVFYLFWKAQKVVAAMYGSVNTLNPFTLYYDAESFGAFFSFFLFTLYGARHHLRYVLRNVWQPGNEDASEPLTYRFAVIGAASGFLFTVLFWHVAGLSLWLAALFMGAYVVTIMTVARVRAELGPPSHDFYSGSRALVGMIGPQHLSPQNLTVATLFRGIDRMYRGHPMPHELEALKLSERAHIDGRTMFRAVMIAAVVAGPVAFWAWLKITFDYGGDWATAYGNEAFSIGSGWLLHRPEADMKAVSFAVGGFMLTSVLMGFYRRFLWFPLHPIGFPLAVSWNMEWFWFPIFLSWLAKTSILRFGGVKAYRTFRYFFFGLILGEFTIGFGLNMIGLLMHKWVYVFWH
ncbi:MAG: hypothetical protein O3A46_03010 [Candidatus Poribacteria bacterium]|nr:hypothetical protein [Candidatus Poribacteria bacterium]